MKCWPVLLQVLLLIIQKTNGMASEWSHKNQNSSYQGKFQWIFDLGKWNLVQVSGEFELTEFSN